MKVNTVLGSVNVNELGVTLMHEHIINIEWNFARAFPGFYDRESVVEMFCEEMEELKPYGVKTFVDATPITLGRDVELLRYCSERAGVNIIACTGLYWHEAPFFHMGLEAEVLAELMIHEIEHGMEGTDSKPGFIKCASQLYPGESENNRNMIRAAAIASNATGLPIYTHSDSSSRLAEYQKQILSDEGISPEKVAFGHTFKLRNLEYIKNLTSDGSYVGCDQLAFSSAESLNALADFLAELLKGDMRKQIFLSCDAALRSDFGRSLAKNLRNRESNSLVIKDCRRDKLFRGLLPKLRERGVNESVIEEVLIGNPQRFFAGKNYLEK